MQAELQRKIKVLNERVWEGRAKWPLVERWLQNFTGETCSADEERIHALYMLSQMMYFGAREIRALLKSMYRESYRYPVIEQIRRDNGDTTDARLVNSMY